MSKNVDPAGPIARLQILDTTSGSTRMVWDSTSRDQAHEIFHKLLLCRKNSVCKSEKQNSKQ